MTTVLTAVLKLLKECTATDKTDSMAVRFIKNLREIDRSALDPKHAILIYDRRLARISPAFHRWSNQFPNAFPVSAGETLKSLSQFSRFSNRIQRRIGGRVHREWTVVAVGGGSVGDFAGFFASVYKRGLNLVHIPSTWLAAIDSSHGGKTALNISGEKNQIGTFYPAQTTFIVRDLLFAQPVKRMDDGIGELAKIALIGGWTRKLKRPHTARVATAARTTGADATALWLWHLLEPAIALKLKIVARDPFETKDKRTLLNLGHTFGHVVEAARGLSHGAAVGQGLLFAIDVSTQLGTLTEAKGEELKMWLNNLGIRRSIAAVPERMATRLLMRDKKRKSDSKLAFVVLVGSKSRTGGGRVRARMQKVELPHLVAIGIETGWIC